MNLHWLTLKFIIDDLIICALKWLETGCKKIMVVVWACENLITFEELHDKLVE